jgi:hypothetical protein
MAEEVEAWANEVKEELNNRGEGETNDRSDRSRSIAIGGGEGEEKEDGNRDWNGVVVARLREWQARGVRVLLRSSHNSPGAGNVVVYVALLRHVIVKFQDLYQIFGRMSMYQVVVPLTTRMPHQCILTICTWLRIAFAFLPTSILSPVGTHGSRRQHRCTSKLRNSRRPRPECRAAAPHCSARPLWIPTRHFHIHTHTRLPPTSLLSLSNRNHRHKHETTTLQ